MELRVILKNLLAWLAMVVIGVLNGVLRQATYAKAMVGFVFKKTCI